MSINSQFEISVLQILIEESRAAYCGRLYKGKQQQHFKVSEFLKDHKKANTKSE